MTAPSDRKSNTLVWISALRGPEPQLCDDEAMLTVEKYERVLARHDVPDECAGCTLDALAQRFPAPKEMGG